MVESFLPREQRNVLGDDVLNQLPWPLGHQYMLVQDWMDANQPIAAAWQLKDVWETLIKLLTTLVMAQDIQTLQNGSPLPEDSPIFYLVTLKNLSTGTWVGILAEYLSKYGKANDRPMIQKLTEVIREPRWVNDHLQCFTKWRNERFGHGIFMQELAVYYHETIEYVEKLGENFRTLVPFFQGMTIYSSFPDQTQREWVRANFPYEPRKVLPPFHGHIADPQQEMLPVCVRFQGETLPLWPVLSVQECTACKEWSAFFLHGYNPYDDGKPVKKPATFLEFILQGSQPKKKEAVLKRLEEVAFDPTTGQPKCRDSSNMAQDSVEPSMSAVFDNTEKNVPVEYLLAKVKDFLASHGSGMISLTGPGGVGKSWFGKTLGQTMRNIECVYMPLQDRTTISEFLANMEKACKNRKPAWRLDKNAISLQEFQIFLPRLLEKLKENCPRKKLVLVLDGFDELTDQCQVLDYLPCSLSTLPADCFVLMCHRPDLKPKAHTLIHNMLADQACSMSIQAKPEEMQEAVKQFIADQAFPPTWTEPILTKSQGIFLYVYHYCSLLNLKLIDSQNLPDKKDIYIVFFDELQKRVGKELFQKYYVPLLCSLAVAKVPVTLDQLVAWGLRQDHVPIMLQDLAHLLERDTSQPNICYSIRHQDIRDFFQEQQDWREQCHKQEEHILVWAKNTFQEILQSTETDLDEPEKYAAVHTISHWNTMVQRSLTTAQTLCPLEELEAMILQFIQQLGEEYPDVGKVYLYYNLACSHDLNTQYDKALEYYQKALDIVFPNLGSNYHLVGMIYNNIAQVYQYQGEYEKALGYLQKALDIALPQLGSDHPNVAGTYNNMAVVYQVQGQYDKALEYYQKALDIALPQLGSGHQHIATTYANMAGVYHYQGKYEKALEYYQKSLEISLPQLGNDHPGVAAIYNDMAQVYHDQGKYDKALEYFQKALDIILPKLGNDHPDIAMAYTGMAGVYQAQGKYDKALEYFQKALDIRLLKLGNDHPGVATTYNNIALVYHHQGKYAKALEYYQKALEISLPKLGSDHPEVATTYNNMAGVYQAQGNYDKALEYYQKALDIDLPQLGSDHPDVATTYNNMAVVYQAQENYDKALEYYQKALDIDLPQLGSDHPSVAATYHNMAVVYKDQGNYDKALEYYQKALDISLPKLGSPHPDVAATYLGMAVTYWKQLRYGKAIEYSQKALKIWSPVLGPRHPHVKACQILLKECEKKLRRN